MQGQGTPCPGWVVGISDGTHILPSQTGKRCTPVLLSFASKDALGRLGEDVET